MTPKQFRALKKRNYTPCVRTPLYEVGDDDPKLVQGQAFSVQELMERQAKGLPMPNLSQSKPVYDDSGFDEFVSRPAWNADLAEISDAHRAAKAERDASLKEDVKRGKRFDRLTKQLKNLKQDEPQGSKTE